MSSVDDGDVRRYRPEITHYGRMDGWDEDTGTIVVSIVLENPHVEVTIQEISAYS